MVTYIKRKVIPLGFEPKTHALEGRCSIQLSYGTDLLLLNERAKVRKKRDTERVFACFFKQNAENKRLIRQERVIFRTFELSIYAHNMEQIIKWGFIGCGQVTEQKSGPAFAKVANSRIEAVMSRSIDKAKSYAERHGISKYYADAQELIDDPEVNAVYIATPPSSHATYAIMSLKSGKPCYVEKPLAASYDECQRINRISKATGVPCFVAYYRRDLEYFRKVKELVKSGVIGKVLTVIIRFAVPPRDLDYNRDNLPWRVQRDIAGGGYFYDLAPHQIDLLQDIFGPIVRAQGYTSNGAGLYHTEDTVSASFQFANGIPGAGSWCFVAHDSAKTDRIEIVGDKGQICFSVFTYQPIALHTVDGRQEFVMTNPEHVQMPMIQNVVNYLRHEGTCTSDCVSATSVNWVMDKILGKM